MHPSAASWNVVPLGSKYSSQALFSNTLNLYSSFNVRNQGERFSTNGYEIEET
jgi:hypothetical protein